MNLAHMVGEHSFENQLQNLMHIALSWAPFVLGICAFAGLLYIAVKRPNFQFERIRIRRK